jgi:glycosyltransferase involved in cell wall biosynthesis
MPETPYESDICLILEGTYPYFTGGLSTWTHELIQGQKDFTFSIVSLLPPGFKPVSKYQLPDNVKAVHDIFLQDLPEVGYQLTKNEKKELFEAIEVPLLNIQHKPSLASLKIIMDKLKKYQGHLGQDVLLHSEESWLMLVRMYLSTLGEGSFLNFFWSYRCLLGGFFSIMLSHLPQSKVYHALCTGFAGLLLARAKVETERSCLLTEHGIYTNERRIEIASAEWLQDSKGMDLNLEISLADRDLKDYWTDNFTGYSNLAYEASEYVITLFEENKEFQIKDGADPNKLIIIPNGVDVDKFASIKKVQNQPPTVAFIGRVVSIKDVKTFIRAIQHLKPRIEKLRCYIMGPEDEEPEYVADCKDLVKKLRIEDSIEFTGKVDLKKYLGLVDVVVLTSISEAQPLVILEAGAAGIPIVATDVGACKELLFGRSDEQPNLGQGGVITPLANPIAVSNGIFDLLSSPLFYQNCSRTIKERVSRYYRAEEQQKRYQEIYQEQIENVSGVVSAGGRSWRV